MRLLCWLGCHRWARRAVDVPSQALSRRMSYEACSRCKRVRDATVAPAGQYPRLRENRS